VDHGLHTGHAYRMGGVVQGRLGQFEDGAPRPLQRMLTRSRMTRQPPGPLERALAAVLQHVSGRGGLVSRPLRECPSFALSAYAADCEHRYKLCHQPGITVDEAAIDGTLSAWRGCVCCPPTRPRSHLNHLFITPLLPNRVC
jgi:hypothetical protein